MFFILEIRRQKKVIQRKRESLEPSQKNDENGRKVRLIDECYTGYLDVEVQKYKKWAKDKLMYESRSY